MVSGSRAQGFSCSRISFTRCRHKMLGLGICPTSDSEQKLGLVITQTPYSLVAQRSSLRGQVVGLFRL